MSHNDANRLMHAVLDGEATPTEAGELDRLMAADPALSSRFDQWRRLFDALGQMPKAYPPEGLVASVMANIPPAPAGQPDPQSRVIGVGSDFSRETIPAPVLRKSRSMASLGGFTMNEQANDPASKRKIWMGVGVATVAAVAVGTFLFDKPSTDTQGTILPAQRYQAQQPKATDIQVGLPTTPQTSPIDPSQAGTLGLAAGQRAEGNRAEGNTASGNTASGNLASGNRAEGNRAEGNRAQGNTASGNLAEGNRAEGNRAEGNRAEGQRAQGNMASGNTASGNLAEGNRAEGNRAEGNRAEGQRAQGNMASGNTASGNRAEGNRAEGNRAEGQRAQGNMASGNTASGNRAEGNRAEGNRAEGQRAQGNTASGNLAEGNKVQ